MYKQICKKLGFDIIEAEKKLLSDPYLTEDYNSVGIDFSAIKLLSLEEIDYLMSEDIEVLKTRDNYFKRLFKATYIEK